MWISPSLSSLSCERLLTHKTVNEVVDLIHEITEHIASWLLNNGLTSELSLLDMRLEIRLYIESKNKPKKLIVKNYVIYLVIRITFN